MKIDIIRSEDRILLQRDGFTFAILREDEAQMDVSTMWTKCAGIDLVVTDDEFCSIVREG